MKAIELKLFFNLFKYFYFSIGEYSLEKSLRFLTLIFEKYVFLFLHSFVSFVLHQIYE